MKRRFLPFLCLGIWGTLAASLQADPPAPADLEFFETKVRPLFAENCFKCHSAAKDRGSLRLDARKFLLEGGNNGPALVPGYPGKSLLIEAINYSHVKIRMPPKSKLPQKEIDLLTEWVRRGAPWPEEKIAKGPKKDFDLKERAKHWSLQPLASPVVPPVKAKDWPRDGLDHFLLAALEAKGLSPAPAADKHTLLRRVTFDLTGLPPTPAEIDAFLNDKAPDAYEKVVDRLLASPRHGERWARHWLDLVRYAETHGHEFDFDIPDAWKYRDYVIRALNDDVPFHQFVREHVAGDLLSDPRRHPTQKTNESVLGTAFWLFGEAKHSPVDSRGDHADRLDNQVDVFTKTFLGMTVACARCHDHKFDAISTKDYYSLVGYLLSSRPDKAILDDPAPRHAILAKQKSLMEELRRLAARQASEQLRLRGSFQVTLLQELLEDPATRKKSGKEEPVTAIQQPFSLKDDEYNRRRKIVLELLEAQKKRHGDAMAKTIRFADARQDRFVDWIAGGEAFAFSPREAPMIFDLTRPAAISRLLPASPASSEYVPDTGPGALRSPTFTITKNKIHFKAAGKEVRVNLILDGLQLIQDPIYGRLTFTVNTKAVPVVAKGWETDAKKPLELVETREPQWHTQDVSMWVGHRAYIEILDEGKGQFLLGQVLFSDDPPPPDAPNQVLLNLFRVPRNKSWDQLHRSYQHLVEETLDLLGTGQLADRPDYPDRAQIINSVLPEPYNPVSGTYVLHLNRWENFPNAKTWERLLDEFKKCEPLPPPQRARTLCDGSAVNEQVYLRGNHRTLGDEAPRRFLEVFGGATPETKGSGRLELAHHMTDPARTPILPRVLVNRLWKHHFGEGLVRSVDDFGLLGQEPSHPDLLDWLAGEFIKEGWSLKKMHRRLVLSAAYRMSSSGDKDADADDPTNRLLHKMPVRRLEGEAIRDALLAVSGRLDGAMFGPPVPPHLTAHMVGRGRPGVSGPLDGAGRRSLYLGVRRNFLNPMFLAFDFPTPFSTMGRRTASNVPAQALTMLNNPLVLQQAEVWAKKVLAEPGLDSKARVTKMYVAALGRTPQPEELNVALEYLAEQARIRPDGTGAWIELAHVIFNLKEFIFVN